MDRRDFLKVAATGVAAVSFPTVFSRTYDRPKSNVVRLAEDRFELLCENPNSAKILQLTDTHFGRPGLGDKITDDRTRKLIRSLVDQQKPDLIFHSGDFINNDTDGVEHSAIGFMNDLGTPWSMVFGNHDHGVAKGSLNLDDYYKRFENHATGFNTTAGARDYCFRIDVKSAKKAPAFTVLGFNCGSPLTKMIVSESQVAWLREQLEADLKAGHTQPILVMQHIPTIEFKNVFDEKAATGRQGEKVCFESDLGAVFELYRSSNRVKGVFCGHDHVNDYIGNYKGVKLAYGRVTGWSGYGDWQRGGRSIDLDLGQRTYQTRVVLPNGVSEKPEWSSTLTSG